MLRACRENDRDRYSTQVTTAHGWLVPHLSTDVCKEACPARILSPPPTPSWWLTTLTTADGDQGPSYPPGPIRFSIPSLWTWECRQQRVWPGLSTEKEDGEVTWRKKQR